MKKKSWILAVALAVAAHAAVRAQIATGRNANVNPGIVDEYIGDRYLQRQVEPKIVCASNNTQLCVAVANDYRTVDQTADTQTGFGEARLLRRGSPAQSRVAAVADAWLGLYRTANGGQNWLNGLVPGFPQDTSLLGSSQPWFGLAAGSDGGLASDGIHFYGVGLFFNRGGTGVIGAYRLTAYNDESAFPIRWDNGFSRVIDQGAATSTGLFADLPSIAVDPSRSGGECGTVYVAYTMFAGAPAGNSFIFVSTSSDCGRTYTKPKKISGTLNANQRVVVAIDPRQGTPTTTGGGTIYALWRTFAPDQIVGVRSTDFGKTWTSPIPITTLSGPANLCVYDQPTKGINDSSSSDQTARALSFASMQVDHAGRIHVVWTERVDPSSGLPRSGLACTTSQEPRIVYTRSSNGFVWTTRHAIDMGTRCETTAGIGRAAGLDRSSPNGTSCPGDTTSRASGPQLQPVLAYNAGKLMLLYSEGRANPETGQFLGSHGYHSGRNTQMDARAAQIDPVNGFLLSTTQVSRYTIAVGTNDIKTVDAATNPLGAKAYSRAYLPQYKGGTIPFKGDHDDLTASETFVWDSPQHFATQAEVPGSRFLALWGGDNRESLFPYGDIDGNWGAYVNPGSGGVSGCNAGIRNSNNYTAFVGSELEAFVRQSFKAPFALSAGNRDRTWVVTIKNRSAAPKFVKLTLTERPGTNASFSQREDVNVIGNSPNDAFCASETYPACTAYRTILPQSSMTFTVFGAVPSPAVAAPFKVNLIEASIAGTTATDAASPSAIVRLNPSPTNPAPLAGANIATSEHHGPSIQGVSVHTNANPTQGNPTQGNPTQGNPTQGNPTQGNTGFSEFSDYTFSVRATDANTLSQYSAFANIANTTEVDKSHLTQLIITRRHKVPALNAAAAGCPLTERTEDEFISTVTLSSASQLAPTQGNPTQGNPTQGNPTQGNPTQGNPTQGNPTQGNNTFALSPQFLPSVGASAAAAYRSTVVASAVAQAVSSVASDTGPDGSVVSPPDTDEVFITVRFFHCDAVASCQVTLPDGTAKTYTQETSTEAVPRSCSSDPCGPDDAATSLVGAIVIAGAADNNNGVVAAAPETAVLGGMQTAGTDLATAGLGGLRGIGSGTLTLSGVGSGTVTKALLYWNGPTQSSDPAVNASITFDGTPLTGTHIGDAYDNNWGFVNTRSYRADVTSIVQSKGDGSYTVADLIKVQNDVTVADINGVSLIVLFDDGNAANDRDVYIYDGNDSTGPGIGSWAQMLPGIQYASGIAQLQLHVGDGQNFSVDNGDDGAVLLNGATVAGNATTQSGDIFQGDSVPDAGSGGTTNGGLWDIKTFDIPAGVLATGSNTLQLTSNQVVDYLGLVVAVVSVPHVQ